MRLRWPYDLDQTRILAGIAQSLVTMIAIASGGGWALYHFISLHEIELARENLTYRKLQNEREPVVEVRVNATSARDPITRDYLINAVATVSNKGNYPDELNFSDAPFKIFMTSMNAEGFVSFTGGVGSPPSSPYKIESAHIMPGESQQYSLLHSVKEPGTYYIEFAVEQSARASQQWGREGAVAADDQLQWYHGIFVRVDGK